ncbi:type III-B CRISPR module-associated Cmr3 family protein [Methylocaldum sp. MU1018]
MSTHNYTTWRLHALDTWFFREARPFDTIGSPELSSHFPPPAPTVAGAIKTLVGRRAGIDWRHFRPKAEGEPRHERYGRLGDLHLLGPFLCRDDRLLFPAPLFLLAKKREPEAGKADGPAADKNPKLSLSRLRIGRPVETDLGIVRLPELPKSGNDDEDKGYKPLENAWLTAAGLKAVLDGGKPDPEDIFQAEQLYATESRLGIGRDNRTGTVRADEARLYQTRHIRPCDNVSLAIGVGGLPLDARPEPGPVRLGGEGRLALMEALPDGLNLPKEPTADDDTHGLILILLTPANLDNCWRLPHSKSDAPAERDSGKAKIWRCEIRGVKLAVHSAVIGKPRREGGWHLAEGKPRRVESFVPAGSAWYCAVENMSLGDAIAELHGIQIGDGEKLGRGLIAVGLWRRDEGAETRF